jgi:hypothetical protein
MRLPHNWRRMINSLNCGIWFFIGLLSLGRLLHLFQPIAPEWTSGVMVAFAALIVPVTFYNAIKG